MKKITDESVYLVDPATTTIPDLGLGDFIKGYSIKNMPYRWPFLLWLLLPIVGWVLVFMDLVIHITRKYITRRNQMVLIYSNGFYFYKQIFNQEEKEIIKFDDIMAISCEKTRNYTNLIYTGTSCKISVLDNAKQYREVFDATYKNENEVAGNYNFDGYVVWALMEAWYPVAYERHIQELNQKQYTSFYYLEPEIFNLATLKEVQVSPKFIKVAEDYVDGQFTYKMENGWMWFYPPKESNRKPFRIYPNKMFDSTVFLVLLKKIWGIA